MKVLLTGGKGMLGRTLVRELGDGFDINGAYRPGFLSLGTVDV